jgi:integrase
MHTQRSARRSYGSGSLTERSGSWYGAWRVGPERRLVSRKIGPVRTRSKADGLTKAQAEARLRELMAEVRPEDVIRRDDDRRRPGHFNIAELTAFYIEHAREHRGLKNGTTLTDYASIERNHLTPFFGGRSIQRIDGALIERFTKHLRTKDAGGRRGGEGKRLSPKSVANYLGFLSTVLNFAVRKKWLAASPMTAVDLPAHKVIEHGDRPIAELNFLEPHEVDQLVGATLPGDYYLLDRALYLLAARTGLRQGELRGLRWSHIDFDGSTVHVLEGVTRGNRSSPKGKRRRSVPLAPSAAEALRALRSASNWTAPHDPVFATPSTGNPMARTSLMERYRVALAAAGLPEGFDFHDLRHTFGTTLARAGQDVRTIQAWMGHADLATTQLYMHYAPKADDAASIDAAFAAPNNPPNNLRVVGGTETNPAQREAA